MSLVRLKCDVVSSNPPSRIKILFRFQGADNKLKINQILTHEPKNFKLLLINRYRFI